MRASALLFLPVLLALRPRGVESQSLFKRLANLATGNTVKENGSSDGLPMAELSNGIQIPLVGLGVGNMMPEFVPAMVSHALRDSQRTYLFDTSNVSNNEHLIAKGIVDGAYNVSKTPSGKGKKLEVHVITKVWYTHLGYERTMLSVKSSIENLKDAIEHPNVDLKLHVLINWPRCYDSIQWMNCKQEENDLPADVKQVGPPPSDDKENAWKGSWKALEELYHDSGSPVASIGVSNFHLQELEALTQMVSVKPHMVEVNAWSLLHDPRLVDFCYRQGIHITAFQLMQGILANAEEVTFAYHHILQVANELTKTMHERKELAWDKEVTAPQVILAWMVQHSITVIPRTTKLRHLKENSGVFLQRVPTMSDDQAKRVATSVEAMISMEDLHEDAHVKLTFHAKDKDLLLYWYDREFDGEYMVASIKKGDTFQESSHPGHVFRVYDSEDKSSYQMFTVKGRYGDHHHVEL